MSFPEFIIETNKLSKTYKDVTALSNLDLKVPEKTIVGFLGPNGSGKSTTIKLLLGLIKPTSGSGKVFGLDIKRDNLEIRSQVGYLAQNPQFYEEMTPRELLTFTAKLFFKGMDKAIQSRVAEMLDLVGLSEKSNRKIRGFSGGERQRLGIAQAQINSPKLLILDEPAAALDPMGRHDVLQIMENLRNKTTIFYSTHILDDVQKVSDRVVILNKGKLVAQGPIEQLLKGSDGVIYSLKAEGKLNEIEGEIRNLPWVRDIHVQHMNGFTHWHIGVIDEQIAKTTLLRKVLAYPEINVIEFQQKQYELEHIFMELVKE